MSDQQHHFALAFLNLLPMADFNTILDLGSGPGYQAEWFKQQGKNVIAGDMVAPIADVPYQKLDAEALPFNGNHFDAVWTHHAFEHMFNPLKCLTEVSRVLKPNGWLFFTVPQIEGTISSGHIHSYDMALAIYHLAICGFDTANGFFGKYSSHLRCAVRKIDTPEYPYELDTSVISLWNRGRLPKSCEQKILSSGRFDKASLTTTWLDGSIHTYV